MYFILRTPNSSIFHGFRNVGVILLLLLNSCVGIAITLLYKYGNVLLKTMTTPVASGVLVFVSYLFFGLSLDIVKTVCAVNVIVDTVLFMNLPAPEQPKSFKVKNHNSRIMRLTTLFCILVGVNIIANESNSSQPSQTKSMPKNLSKNTLEECHHDSCKSLRNDEKDLPFREFPINFATITADDARRGAMNIWASLALSERLSTMLEYIPSMKNLDVSEQLHIYSKTMMYKPKERLQDGPLFESNAGFAIILHGNARSLLSKPIQAFWKEWMSMRNDHDVIVFDVMDYNPIDNVQEIRSLVSSENSLEDANETDVAKAFTNLGITRIRVSKVAKLRKIPQNGSLHAILDNEYLRKTMNQKTGSLAYSTKKVIGLDTMIKWESKEKRQFSHVIFIQADLIYTPFVDNYRHGKSFFNDMNKMQDISFVVNDIVGITPRRHAMSYVSTINLNAAPATRDELLRANQTNQMMYKDFTGASTVTLPHTQLSIDGFLFTGNRLYLGDNSDVVSKHRNLIEDILPFHMDNELLLFVREMNNTVCVEDKTMNLWLSKRNIKIDIC